MINLDELVKENKKLREDNERLINENLTSLNLRIERLLTVINQDEEIKELRKRLELALESNENLRKIIKQSNEDLRKMIGGFDNEL